MMTGICAHRQALAGTCGQRRAAVQAVIGGLSAVYRRFIGGAGGAGGADGMAWQDVGCGVCVWNVWRVWGRMVGVAITFVAVVVTVVMGSLTGT
jgi:hypothetical protein